MEQGRVVILGKKRILIVIVSVLAVAGICISGGYIYRRISMSKKEVVVTPISYISGGGYMNQNTIGGMVSNNYMQEVMLDNECSIKEVFVSKGDKVSKGAELLSYDTTVLEMDLTEQDLKIQQTELDIKALKREIEELKNTKPAVKINKDQEQVVNTILDFNSKADSGQGTKNEPYRFLCSNDTIIKGSFINALAGYDETGKNKDNEAKTAVLQFYGGNGEYLWTIHGDDYMPMDSNFSWSMSTDDGILDEPEVAEEGMTRKEIDDRLMEKRQELKNLETDKKDMELQVMKIKKKIEDSIVKAVVDGVVMEVQNKDQIDSNMPYMTINGSEGAYINGAVSELLLSDVKTGDSVTVQYWNENGAFTSQGTIIEVSSYPVDNNVFGYGGGNSNVSYYPITISVEGCDNIPQGQYVEIILGGPDIIDEGFVCLPKAYIRRDNGSYYVYIADDNDHLIKKYVEIGRIVYGDMYEITDGITMEDKIAFPYGKYVREGTRVKTQGDDIFYK